MRYLPTHGSARHFMTESTENAIPDFDLLVQNAQIEIAVPTIPADSIDQGIINVLSGSQRRQLFQGLDNQSIIAHYSLDEHITVYILLKFSKKVPIEHLEALKKHISLNLDAMLVDVQRQESSINSKRDRIVEGPSICSVNLECDDMVVNESDNLTFIAWRRNLELVQSTRLNFHRIALVATITLVHESDEGETSARNSNEYMVEHKLSQPNVLVGFQSGIRDSQPSTYTIDVNLKTAGLNLPVSRLSGGLASPSLTPSYKPARRAARRIFPLSPVISLRTSYSKPSPSRKTILMTIDVEVYQSTAHKIELESVIIDPENAEACMLAGSDIFPVILSPQDSLSLVYEISPSAKMSAEKQSYFTSQSCPIIITTTARPLLADDTRPLLVSKWKFLIDPTSSSRPSTGEKSVTPRRTQSLHIPNITIGNGRSMARTASSSAANGYTAMRPTTTPSLLQKENTGLVVTFSVPETAKLGEIFEIEVSVLNQSPSRRRISLLLDESDRKNLPPWPKTGDVVILEDTALNSLHRSLLIDTIELISLVNDVHIGPIPTSSCFSFLFKVKAFKRGVATIDGLRIVDLGDLENPRITECRLPALMISG
ncbi:hypothetical protein NEOLI_003763 [Neolecta irregularis DAH-3]|uniref:Trafficking protein particle complex II-specific subunit 65 IgD3 domain-containing protein n=1 Tax=Neolecta irregularis (strain DAH-3) TaxID=1198029 RepID=A0A1U7LLU6_NEOID|nr:hypothetical protein NEOLI_003763 [Neolecta irregularis DAH-3]|eukprot:OLL23634.1 hypothetical protein NEOLI_003763 [Neolecta irregularis DAH-3]